MLIHNYHGNSVLEEHITLINIYMELTPAFIASLIGGKVEGDPDVKISGFAKIEEAKPGDITFLANKKYTHCIYTTKAGAVLVRDDFQPEEPVSAVLIRVPDDADFLPD